MWGWLKAIVEALVTAILKIVIREVKKPDEIEDVNTPRSVLDRWNRYLDRKLRKHRGRDPK